MVMAKKIDGKSSRVDLRSSDARTAKSSRWKRVKVDGQRITGACDVLDELGSNE